MNKCGIYTYMKGAKLKPIDNKICSLENTSFDKPIN